MEAQISTDAPISVSAHAHTEAVGERAPNETMPAQLSKGDELGRYVVLRQLGAGAMGTVYLGYDPELDRKVALKLLRGATSSARRRALLREAQAMAKLSHTHVVAVYDVGEHDGQVYVAMAFVEGGRRRHRVDVQLAADRSHDWPHRRNSGLYGARAARGPQR